MSSSLSLPHIMTIGISLNQRNETERNEMKWNSFVTRSWKLIPTPETSDARDQQGLKNEHADDPTDPIPFPFPFLILEIVS